MQNTKDRVKVDGQLSEEFEVHTGLKQGDGLAPMLFNLTLEYVMRRTVTDMNATLMNKTVQIIGYADDLNILERSVDAIKETFENLEVAAGDVGLRINESKTKLLIQSRKRRERMEQSIALAGHNFEVVDNFIYLGSNVNTENDENQEVQRRIAAGNRALYSLLPVLKSQNIHRSIKLRLYKTLIRTVICYGSETWIITEKSANLLDRLERKILRRIFGPVNDRGTWRARYNHEIYQRYKDTPIVMHIKLMRLRWAAHVQRMPDTRVAKKVFEGQPVGRRRAGRPRARWGDNVSKDARELLRTRSWKRASCDRDG